MEGPYSIFRELRTTPARIFSFSGAYILDMLLFVNNIPPKGMLSGPLDITNHQTNTLHSFPIGAAAGHIFARLIDRWFPNAGPRTSRAIIMAGAATVGTLINGLTETKYGQQLVGPELMQTIFEDHIHGEPNDLFYGIGSTTASSCIAVRDTSNKPPQRSLTGEETDLLTAPTVPINHPQPSSP